MLQDLIVGRNSDPDGLSEVAIEGRVLIRPGPPPAFPAP